MHRKKIFFAVMLFLLVMPVVTSAAADGVIPCATSANDRPCTLCDFVVGFHNIVNYGMGLITIAAIVGIFFAGVMYIISSGDQKMMEQAKGFLKASLMGFAFVFLGWLTIDITMWALSAKKSTDEGGVLGIQIEKWNKFTCSTVSSSGQTSGGNVPLGTPGTTVNSENCCVGGPGGSSACTQARSSSDCPVGATYKTGACSAISDCKK